MNYEDIVSMLGETGLPFAYHHFAEGESPDPPFLVYLTPSSDNFAADGIVYSKFQELILELYTDIKQPETEKAVEDILDVHGLFYNKTEVWIESERLYEVRYTAEILLTDEQEEENDA